MGEPIRMELRMDPPCEDCKAKDAKIARLREGIGTDDGKAHLVARWFMDEAARLLQAEIARLRDEVGTIRRSAIAAGIVPASESEDHDYLICKSFGDGKLAEREVKHLRDCHKT